VQKLDSTVPDIPVYTLRW